jgi:hypothetical protein
MSAAQEQAPEARIEPKAKSERFLASVESLPDQRFYQSAIRPCGRPELSTVRAEVGLFGRPAGEATEGGGAGLRVPDETTDIRHAPRNLASVRIHHRLIRPTQQLAGFRVNHDEVPAARPRFDGSDFCLRRERDRAE